MQQCYMWRSKQVWTVNAMNDVYTYCKNLTQEEKQAGALQVPSSPRLHQNNFSLHQKLVVEAIRGGRTW